ncbi:MULTISPECIES: ATP-NAD kinase family protein [unclassified Haloarcula]|uniref:ATP-NAD kinase family protein n=1 Tax=unclassified Haloarcula TaxID=2624677 RepID=UPI000EF15849|nr:MULTISPECIES: ATP-NAD kinase family protein [unclassified Haloarcula]RLM34034.1 N-acetylglucosamine-1-phosphate uridyltransferase [Haloarcula sp. Atlit-120R]RLM42393.1 N-acetylglucosamine-1-phosphate uridyltransferase [Haloarcula sp. Atlit-47R]RLM95420.1 N-acetylglucosamine-1-phosphate uridyltransferase [Haloarcula sp. Atlit-7R]
MRRIGVVVNPIAGMGGRVGLKGTDGKVDEARRRGAEQRAPDRARIALESLAQVGADVELLTYGDPMGADIAREVGFDPTVVGAPATADETTSEDTRAAVRAFVEADADVILFVGGDGTAVDVAMTLDELGATIPILGVPAGVKVYSSVFGVSPRAAGRIVARFSETERAEVNDIDEDAFRGGEVVTELRAVATVPVADQRQSAKQLGGGSVGSLAESVADAVEPGVTYILGPGSTVGAIKGEIGFDGTTLGVDVWRDGEVLVRDAAESDILDALGDRNIIVVSPIGGQGFVFGRGNQQLSPAVIRQCDLEVVASRRKLDGIGTLRVDTGDSELDEELRGWLRVRVGRHERRLVEVV